MLKRPPLIAFILVVLLALAVLNLPARPAARLKMAVSGVFLPLFGAAGAGHYLAEKTAGALTPRRTLVDHIEQLRQENLRLQQRLVQGEEAIRENARLREILGAPKPAAWKCKLARVIGRDPANWWRTLQIDLGLQDGLRPNLTVWCPDGLVGRTAEIGPARAQVVLVGDPACRVSARILETRDNTGVVVPNAGDPADNSVVLLTYLSRNSALKPGQTVLTSGQGGIFPSGISIGKILDYRLVEFGLYAEARVKLAVDHSSLEEVWVLLP